MASTNLRHVPTVELRRELDRRAELLEEMQARRAEIETELKQIDADLRALGETAPSKAPGSRHRRAGGHPRSRGRSAAARTRSSNTRTLAEALQQALKGRTLGIGEVIEAVQKAGYKSNARSFRTMVNLTLLKRKDLFKKMGRGQYTAKSM